MSTTRKATCCAAPGPGARQARALPQRKRLNQMALTLSLAAMAFGVFWLVWILWETMRLGVGGLAWPCLHRNDAAAQRGRRPGQRHFRLGVMVMLATFVGTPIGILAGVYLAEYGRQGWLGFSSPRAS
jgi:phosphate transport system permease protein